MKLRRQRVDPQKATTKELAEAINEIFQILAGNSSFADQGFGATVTLSPIVGGTELERTNPRKFQPVGFIPWKAYDVDGNCLAIASYKFNDRTPNGAGWHGITVTVAAGTLFAVTGYLVGG